MSRKKDEQYIHDWIEQQDPEGKEKALARLTATLMERGVDITPQPVSAAAVPKRGFWNAGRIACMSVALVLVLTGVLLSVLLPGGSILRYCPLAEYNVVDSSLSIVDYAKENGKNILSVNWENNATFVFGNLYELKEDGSVIGIGEEVVTNDGATVDMYVTGNKLSMDFLEEVKVMCTKKNKINSVNVIWNVGAVSCAQFEHKGYIYYIQVSDSENLSYAFDIAKELLTSAK